MWTVLPVVGAGLSSPAITGRGSLAILSSTGLEEAGMLMLLEADRFTEFRSGLSMLIANKMEPNPKDQKMMTIQRNVIWFMPSFSQKKNIKLNALMTN